jgi:hypothetical protein
MPVAQHTSQNKIKFLILFLLNLYLNYYSSLVAVMVADVCKLLFQELTSVNE